MAILNNNHEALWASGKAGLVVAFIIPSVLREALNVRLSTREAHFYANAVDMDLL